MPDDRDVTHSLAYRKNVAAILAGNVPEKYTRLLPFIEGEKIVELGSAEGVLACLLAKQGKSVTAIERQKERHNAAKRLASKWGVSGVTFVNGDTCDNLDRLKDADTLVAVRMIYYLLDDLDAVFAEVAKHIPTVVLCGNKNRAHWWREGLPNRNDRADNYYASAEGMKALLERHGYTVTHEVTEGDPIVVGGL
jgi:2-polyprenyl-3-methyl-5-hydroxy-6-metoxy-1,4-benzoquinol methylase